MALTTTGAVFSWGCGLNGRLGHGDNIGLAFPEQITAISHIVIIDIACGDSHSACITENGLLYIWGSSDNGKLGFAQVVNVDKEEPEINEFFDSTLIKQIFLGLNNSFALTRSGDLYAWGSSRFGKFGIPKSSDWSVELPYKLWK